MHFSALANRYHATILLVALGGLSACTAVVDSVVESRYGQYNRSTDWAKNEAILLNIVRASEYQPLNFLSYQPYSGSATVSATASSPAFTLGPYLTNAQKQFSFGNGAVGGGATAVGTINVTQMDTQGFYAALLTSVQYSDLYAFQKQGYPRELLFRLFTDYVSIKSVNSDRQGHNAFIISNNTSNGQQCISLQNTSINRLYSHMPPESRPHEICFKDLVKFALLSGLSSEIRTISAASGSSAKQPAASGSSSNQSSSAQSTEGRLCFDGALANRAIMEFGIANIDMPSIATLKATEYHPVCGQTEDLDKWLDTSNTGTAAPSKPVTAAKAVPPAVAAVAAEPAAVGKPAIAAKPPKPATATANSSARTNRSAGIQSLTVLIKTKAPTGYPVWDIHLLGQHTVEVGTRSTFSMYSFLGRLLRKPESETNALVGPPEDNSDRQILTVNKGQPAGCFVAAVFDVGVYCVPIDGAENTKSTFSILSQLLALKTTTGDLQLTPTLRLLPQ